MEKDVFHLVHYLINHPGSSVGSVRSILSERLGRYVLGSDLAALEEKVWEWSKEHPVIWNVGIGPTASFVPTLTRLLFDRTKDLYGPYDQITHVRLPPAEAVSSSTAPVRLGFEILTEVLMRDNTKQLEELKELVAEESYFGYGKFCDLMLEAVGRQHLWQNLQDALEGKRHLLLIENLHVPLSLDRLLSFVGERFPSIFANRRWLISATSKNVCEKSRDGGDSSRVYHLTQEYYYAPPFDDLRGRDWAVLIEEGLRDAARSIYVQLSDKGDEQFWLQVAHKCLYYGILYHPLQEEGAAAHPTYDELVRCWVAEDLIFSMSIPNKIPADTDQKQSDYYRSAYEAGKVVIHALQEYSLLPIYSISSSSQDMVTGLSKLLKNVPRLRQAGKVVIQALQEYSLLPVSTSMSSSQDVVTGVSKLAEHVPRLNQDALTTHFKNSNQLKWVSFMNDGGRHVSWDWETRGDTTMTTLILRGCSNMSKFSFDKLLTSYLRVLDLSYTPITSLPPFFSSLLNLYLLSLRGCSQLQTLSPPPSTSDKETSSPLAHLKNLQVFDMNGVPVLELKLQDGSNKSNLHYLDLSGSKFTNLPSEFFCEMSSLEEIIFGNCTNLTELPPSMAQLSNLLVLHVEGTQITTFPEHMFQKMQRLHTLKLINNMLLMSLPMSLSESSSLEVVHLCNCMSLRSLPSSLSKAKCLKEIHISNCISLTLHDLWEQLSFLENLYIQAWEGLEDIKILGHPNLRTFSLSGPWVRCLSLCGCSKLKSINFNDDLIALEDVDLSGTAIDEVPNNLPNLPQLNMLLLLGVPCSMRFPWHQLVRFPKVFNLDHCANDENQIPIIFYQQETYGNENQHKEKTTNTAHIKINDPRMFISFNKDAVNKLVKEGQFLQSFMVQVKPCSVRGKGACNNEVELYARMMRHSPYDDVQFTEAASIMPMMELQPMQRHVEISAVNQYPNGLRHVLSMTKTIFITDDNFVRCLTDLNYSLIELEECLLQLCHQMTIVLRIESVGTEVLQSLRILQASCLKNLLCIVQQVKPGHETAYKLITLKLLKHIHLEHCPRLEKMFPCSLSLPALETLVILFCSNLKTIFYKQADYKVAPPPLPKTPGVYLRKLEPYTEVAPTPLPNIKRIYLQELPQFQHFHEDLMFRFEMPNWEKLFVSGCRTFHHLPLLKMEHLRSKVEVSGEREWWDRLQLKLPEQSDNYLYLAPPKFVSRKKHVIESYLR